MTDTAAAPSVDGAALLDEVEAFHRRFNIFPTEHAYVAVALWDAHAHLIDALDGTARIAFLSPEPGSGKSRALEIIETLTPRAATTVNASANALFRLVAADAGTPTLLFDEIDTVFGPKAGGNEEVRGFLNSGYRRGAKSLRCVGEGTDQKAGWFDSFCAVAMAGLGSLPDTILTRSVIIRMRKKAPNEKCEPYRRRIHEKQGHILRDRLAEWTATIHDQIAEAWPEMPEGVTDRPADVWEPLLAVADAAGGHWPERARAACLELVNAAREGDDSSLGIRLLTDLRDKVFCGADRMPTAVILECLLAMDDSPWADMDDKPITPRMLARMLGDYVTPANKPIKPRTFRTASGTPKGYYAEDLADAWMRYCPPPPEKSATSATSATSQVSSSQSVADGPHSIRNTADETATLPFPVAG
ncbi:DUF3631 domain-containing protein [Streptomyces caniscabiei]|uniref:DUF3631 domain-containing protein n=1 Tax=Streptomyces caniscabiei TaxID=2746961 RepID=UPI0029AE6960|nr:DUF3631 domain-containing protein [Streptomyces caniscabiei]MDX2601606.1 DUF3631 domain-containing protein [Streptomyces caniscabiei]MDX2741816.1 DUF3631 domain-containing protein [Streptomyces caniscabiei]MDX2782807.1 DUF3631 domain-containing protein [Streptomyces caniscabiei]